MTKEQYLALCEKYLNGDFTPEEEALIKQYQDTEGLLTEHLADISADEQARLKTVLYNRLQQSMQPESAKVISINRWWYAAAAVLFFATVGTFFIRNSKIKSEQATAANKVKKAPPILPGSNKAILTLANGNTIVLDDAKNDSINNQGGLAISKSGKGIVIKKGDQNTGQAALALNTITIPRGGKYYITLPDGTQVWLNSASALTFPTVFTGKERKVTLTGEAYFEVAKNKAMPFKIDVNGKQVVEVLGTHFNINAYTDEKAITTTLLEGSVRINYNDKATLIKPGQMAVNHLGRDVSVKPADIDEVMAWKNDEFIFNNENIVSVMKKISRWYDVDVAFKGDMADVNFDGNYSRGKGLESLLKNIELINKVRFVTEGRRITVIAK